MVVHSQFLCLQQRHQPHLGANNRRARRLIRRVKRPPPFVDETVCEEPVAQNAAQAGQKPKTLDAILDRIQGNVEHGRAMEDTATDAPESKSKKSKGSGRKQTNKKGNTVMKRPAGKPLGDEVGALTTLPAFAGIPKKHPGSMKVRNYAIYTDLTKGRWRLIRQGDKRDTPCSWKLLGGTEAWSKVRKTINANKSLH